MLSMEPSIQNGSFYIEYTASAVLFSTDRREAWNVQVKQAGRLGKAPWWESDWWAKLLDPERFIGWQ